MMKIPKIHELLGTKDRREQYEAVQRLKNAEVLDVVIRFDPRKVKPVEHVFVVGGTPEPMAVIKIMEMARDMVLEQVINSSGQPEMPPGEPPQHPDPQAEDTGEPSPESSDPADAAE
jgi:hypothetical protein